ncbi:iron ABC transporter permease [Aminithiophilus ramosus]|uniref:Iron ABC transporter permease n=1 Tax=Aminithiophilus ramosus TaxID=3029084 RepID=A0A9Q7AP57_9BACT|nr:iron ABC transporter permease [Aminithiophilus ramosus]QTX32977.1 iron ABC transporter permease [Aminithiophilus ramosus]
MDREHLTEHRRRKGRHLVWLLSTLTALLLLVSFFRITFGDWEIAPLRALSLLVGPVEKGSPEGLVVRTLRLPRLLAAVGAGGTLSVSGVVLQGLLSNPLAEPYTLGIASGAAFGAAFAFSFGVPLTATSFIGAFGALCLSWFLARRAGGATTAYLVLAGIIVNAFLSAGVTLLKALADDRLAAIVLWLMGGFSGATMEGAMAVWLGGALVFIPAFIKGREMDALSLGEGRGALLGIEEGRLRLLLLASATLATALTVSRFGIIGFVGLVAPHLLRLLLGPEHRPLLLASFLGGGALLAASDGLAQKLGELPVGVITALLGGPVFCWILLRGSRR